MAKERNSQKQAWLDNGFVDRLEKLQAKKRLQGKKVSLGDLTKELIQTATWEKLELEILNTDKNISKSVLKMNINFDGDIFK